MKKNLWLSISTSALLLTTVGCFKEEAKQPEAGVNPRAALIQALDKQATTLVNGLNKVIIEGKFLQNMSLENPPQPIPMSDDNEISKAIDYLLSNQTQQGSSYNYSPDSRICSEVMAKNNPSTCIEVMKQVRLTQTPANDTDGTLEIAIGNARPLYLNYEESKISIHSALAEIVKALGEVDQVLKQNGEAGMRGPLPTTYAGAFELSATSFMSISNLRFSITSAVDLKGQNEIAEAYSLQIAAMQNLVNISLDSVTGIGSASASLPPAVASFVVHNDQNIAHEVQVQFPGLSGALTLDNSLERIILQAVKLTSPDAYVNVDGQVAAHFATASQIDAQLQSYPGGDKTVSFIGQFTAQIDIVANAFINGNGQLNVYVAQGTELYFKMNSQQAKLVSGSLQLIGTDSFNGMMNAQQNDCIEGQQNAPIPLQTVACE